MNTRICLYTCSQAGKTQSKVAGLEAGCRYAEDRLHFDARCPGHGAGFLPHPQPPSRPSALFGIEHFPNSFGPALKFAGATEEAREEKPISPALEKSNDSPPVWAKAHLTGSLGSFEGSCLRMDGDRLAAILSRPGGFQEDYGFTSSLLNYKTQMYAPWSAKTKSRLIPKPLASTREVDARGRAPTAVYKKFVRGLPSYVSPQAESAWGERGGFCSSYPILIMNTSSSNVSLLMKRANFLKRIPTPEETRVRFLLEQMGIRFVFQKVFCASKTGFIVDFYFPKPVRLCLEIDGHHHSVEPQLSKDRVRDEYLSRERGMTVKRLDNSVARIITPEQLHSLIHENQPV